MTKTCPECVLDFLMRCIVEYNRIKKKKKRLSDSKELASAVDFPKVTPCYMEVYQE